MAIATTAAILGAAAIAGGTSILSANATKKAASKAAAAAKDNTAENNALAREMYGANVAILDPFRSMGLAAGRTLSEMLLGPSASPAALPAPAAAPYEAQPALSYAGGGSGGGTLRRFPTTIDDGDVYHNGGDLPALRALAGSGGGTVGNAQYGAPQPVPGAVTTAAPAKSAWDTFRDSTNYKFRFDEGTRAINQGYAAAGALESGAALKALLKYGQEFAGNELGNYMNLLSGQQNMGLNAARAVAGVGGDLVNNVTSNNNAAAGAVANAALLKGNANAMMYQGIGDSLSRALGALGPSSYGKAVK